MFSSVDLPHPLLPTNETNSPGSISKVTSAQHFEVVEAVGEVVDDDPAAGLRALVQGDGHRFSFGIQRSNRDSTNAAISDSACTSTVSTTTAANSAGMSSRLLARTTR